MQDLLAHEPPTGNPAHVNGKKVAIVHSMYTVLDTQDSFPIHLLNNDLCPGAHGEEDM